jgi:hypothetical protein
VLARQHAFCRSKRPTGYGADAGSDQQVVPASNDRALQNPVLELQWLLGKKALEEPRSFPTTPRGKKAAAAPIAARKHGS